MKFSVSLPDHMGHEIKALAEKSDRNVSWWIRQAWEVARTQMMRGDQHRNAEQKAMKILNSLKGSLAKSYPGVDSVTLSHTAFHKNK